MNCDEAFEYLTDGSLRERPELQAHLEQCPRCRQMRDVLEPALDLFGSRADSPFDEPPAAADAKQAVFLSPEAVHLAERTAADLAAAPAVVPASPRSRWKVISRYAAVCVLGAAAALALTALPFDDNRSAPVPPPTSPCVWKNSQERQREVQAPQVVKSCVACHLQEEGGQSNIQLDRFLRPNDAPLPGPDEGDATAATSFEWHICVQDAQPPCLVET